MRTAAIKTRTWVAERRSRTCSSSRVCPGRCFPLPSGVLALASLLSTGWAAATAFTAAWLPAGPGSGCPSGLLSNLWVSGPTLFMGGLPFSGLRASGVGLSSHPSWLFSPPLHWLGFCHCLHSYVALSWPSSWGPLSPVAFLGTPAPVSCGLLVRASPDFLGDAPDPRF